MASLSKANGRRKKAILQNGPRERRDLLRRIRKNKRRRKRGKAKRS